MADIDNVLDFVKNVDDRDPHQVLTLVFMTISVALATFDAGKIGEKDLIEMLRNMIAAWQRDVMRHKLLKEQSDN